MPIARPCPKESSRKPGQRPQSWAQMYCWWLRSTCFFKPWIPSPVPCPHTRTPLLLYLPNCIGPLATDLWPQSACAPCLTWALLYCRSIDMNVLWNQRNQTFTSLPAPPILHFSPPSQCRACSLLEVLSWPFRLVWIYSLLSWNSCSKVLLETWWTPHWWLFSLPNTFSCLPCCF